MTTGLFEKLNPINWIKEAIKIPLLYCVTFLGAILSVLHFQSIDKFLGIYSWMEHNRPILGGTCLLLASLVIIKIIEKFILFIHVRKAKKEVLKYIDSLCLEELQLLLSAVKRKQNTVWLDITNNAIAISLCNKGLLNMSTGTVTTTSYNKWPHVITDFVFEELSNRYASGYYD